MKKSFLEHLLRLLVNYYSLSLQACECKWLTEFNPSKCQIGLLRVTLNHKPVEAYLTRFMTRHLNWFSELNPPIKYLGVTIDSKLNFNNHIDSVAKKANGTRAFLSRNLRLCSLSIRAQYNRVNQRLKYSTYKTYIRPMVISLGSSHPQKYQQIKLRASLTSFSPLRHRQSQLHQQHICYSSMLHDLELPTLEQRRHLSRLTNVTMLYKIYTTVSCRQ